MSSPPEEEANNLRDDSVPSNLIPSPSNEHQEHHNSGNTVDDSVSFNLHQNTTATSNAGGIGETPFFNKLVDPFGESPLQPPQQTPVTNNIRRNLFGSLARSKKPSDMFQKMRQRHQQAQMVEYETQSQEHGIMIDDEEEEETQGLEDSFMNADFDKETQKIPAIDTQVIATDTQLINDTQLIPSDLSNTNEAHNFEVPSTQVIRRNIEVPSTIEKKQHTYRPDVFDEITSQASQQSDDAVATLNFGESNKIEIASDDEIENTTMQYELLEIDKKNPEEEEEEEEESSSMKYYSGLPEDSMKIYDQLRLKRRQYSEMDLNKKPKLPRTMTDVDTPSKNHSVSTASWLLDSDKQKESNSSYPTRLRHLSSPSTEVPNSSPSIVQLTKSGEYNNIQSSPTTQVINISQDPETYRKTVEIISSKQSLSEEEEEEDAVLPTLIDHSSSNIKQSTQDSPLTDIEEEQVYRNNEDELSRKDIKFFSSVWARTGEKFYPTIIKKVLPDGFLIIHQGKQVNLQGFLNIFPLDIKIGDRVKIFNKKRIHCVTGLSSELEDGDEESIKCIRGFNTLYVMPCVKNEIDYINGVEEKIRLSDIYLVNSIWTKRSFIKELDSSEYQDSLVSNLPKIRGRHSKEMLELSPHKNSPPVIIRNLMPSPSSTGTTVTTTSAILKKCCFTITSSTELQRNHLKNLILSHGGKVLENGLNEIFDKDGEFQISKFYSSYEFGLVISSNGYCRSAKYLEALALGWPILSHKFIEDMGVTQRLENFEPYLLPAGESNYLGTVKSLNIFLYMKKYLAGQPLSLQIGNNNSILSRYQIFQLNSGDSKDEILIFLFKALGLIEISTFDSFEKLISTFASHDLKKKILLFTNDNEDEILNLTKNYNQDEINIIDWEWVVQCVITGMRLEFK